MDSNRSEEKMDGDNNEQSTDSEPLWLFPAYPFSLDVRFNEASDRILAKRFLVSTVNISDTDHEKEMEYLRGHVERELGFYNRTYLLRLHVCHQKRKYPIKRCANVCTPWVLPILQRSISTIQGVLALILAESYFLLAFFKMVFLVVFFGAKHGMFLLLVLLSLFRPGSCKVENPKKPETQLSTVEKSFPHPYCIKHTKFTSCDYYFIFIQTG
ncbi:Patched-related [Carabus blaptoides fortunei]